MRTSNIFPESLQDSKTVSIESFKSTIAKVVRVISREQL